MADLLLHVIDCADPERQDNIQQVHNVLEEIKAHELRSFRSITRSTCWVWLPVSTVMRTIVLPGLDLGTKGEGLDLCNARIAELWVMI